MVRTPYTVTVVAAAALAGCGPEEAVDPTGATGGSGGADGSGGASASGG